MTEIICRTPAGIVLRDIFASGERAWRLNDNGTWAYCGDHKGPWVTEYEIHVPAHVFNAIVAWRAINGNAPDA